MNLKRCELVSSKHPPHTWVKLGEQFSCTGEAAAPVMPAPIKLPDIAESERVAHPKHYNKKVPGIECIEVVQHFNFNLGNVIKYVWRAGDKGDVVEDLKKARQYLDFEIARIEGKNEL